MTETAVESTADVIVVGAGPAGSTTAYYLAQAGLDVLLLEKTAFPREKVCGDGLTPRATKQLVGMGIDVSSRGRLAAQQGPADHRRRRPAGAATGRSWPATPDYGLVRTARRLRRDCSPAGPEGGRPAARARQRHRPGPGRADRPDHRGDRAKLGAARRAQPHLPRAAGGRRRRQLHPAVARDGPAPREDRPMGVAVRTYFTAPRHDDDYLESWLELWDPGATGCCPATAGSSASATAPSNVGLGILNSSPAFGKVDYREVLRRGWRACPPEWGFTPENHDRPDPRRRAADGLQPHSRTTPAACCWSATRAAWSTRSTARASPTPWSPARSPPQVIVQAHARPDRGQRERALRGLPQALKDTYGGYYTLGRVFVKLIGNPKVMQLATQRGLTHPILMRFALKLLANLTDPRAATRWTASSTASPRWPRTPDAAPEPLHADPRSGLARHHRVGGGFPRRRRRRCHRLGVGRQFAHPRAAATGTPAGTRVIRRPPRPAASRGRRSSSRARRRASAPSGIVPQTRKRIVAFIRPSSSGGHSALPEAHLGDVVDHDADPHDDLRDREQTSVQSRCTNGATKRERRDDRDRDPDEPGPGRAARRTVPATSAADQAADRRRRA